MTQEIITVKELMKCLAKEYNDEVVAQRMNYISDKITIKEIQGM